MMAVNRYRLRHRAKQGARGAKLALALLAQTDTLLGVILLGNTLVAAAAATLTAVITKRAVWRRRSGAGARDRRHLVRDCSSFRNHAEGDRRRARRPPRAAGELSAGADAARSRRPIVWFVNLFVQRLAQACCAIQPGDDGHALLTQEELRSLVLEGQYFRGKHRRDAREPVRSRRGQRRRRDDAAQSDRSDRSADASRRCWRSSSPTATTRGCRRTRTSSTTSSASST